MDFLINNLGNILVGSILVIVVFLIIKGQINNKKKGNHCSGCTQANCPSRKI